MRGLQIPFAGDTVLEFVKRVDKGAGDHAFDTFPDKLYRIQVRGVRWEMNEYDAKRFSSVVDRGGTMATKVVQHDHNYGIVTVSSTDVFKEANNGVLRGIAQECVCAVAGQRIEADGIGFQFGRVLADFGFAEMPDAGRIRCQLWARLVKKPDGDILLLRALIHQCVIDFYQFRFELLLGIIGAAEVMWVRLGVVHLQLLPEDAPHLDQRQLDAPVFGDEVAHLFGIPLITLQQLTLKFDEIRVVQRGWRSRRVSAAFRGAQDSGVTTCVLQARIHT